MPDPAGKEKRQVRVTIDVEGGCASVGSVEAPDDIEVLVEILDHDAFDCEDPTDEQIENGEAVVDSEEKWCSRQTEKL